MSKEEIHERLGLLKSKVRRKKDLKNVKWFFDPEKFIYVRESEFMCCNPNYKPIKKRDKGWLLIGLEKPIKQSLRCYKGRFWWLKDYDFGMPDAKRCYGRAENLSKEGLPYSMPCEAVCFEK